MLLRGVTVSRKAVVFSIEDKPLKLSDDKIVLTKEKNSPIIIADSVSRGSSEYNFFEGDLVIDNDGNRLGTVVYLKGFRMYDFREKEVKELPPIDTVKFEVNKNLQRDNEDELNDLWVYKNMPLSVNSFLVYEGKKAILKINSYQMVPLNQIKLNTGIVRNGKLIAFGDTCCGGTVVLHGYNPMVRKLNNTYIELKEA